MIVKWLFDRIVSFIGLIILMPIFLVVAILIRIKMPGPVMFCQYRVGKNGTLFKCHKFRTMSIDHDSSSISFEGETRITHFGAKLRKYKIDELPELWDVFIGNMSFVGPRPDVPGYADKLIGVDRMILSVLPGITGPATLKYKNEEHLIAKYVEEHRGQDGMSDHEIAQWYNDNVIYPDKVKINIDYLMKRSFWTDLQIIFKTILITT